METAEILKMFQDHRELLDKVRGLLELKIETQDIRIDSLEFRLNNIQRETDLAETLNNVNAEIRHGV